MAMQPQDDSGVKVLNEDNILLGLNENNIMESSESQSDLNMNNDTAVTAAAANSIEFRNSTSRTVKTLVTMMKTDSDANGRSKNRASMASAKESEEDPEADEGSFVSVSGQIGDDEKSNSRNDCKNITTSSSSTSATASVKTDSLE